MPSNNPEAPATPGIMPDGGASPMMDADPDMGGNMDMMPQDMNAGPDMGNETPNPYDNNFDAGVEANEETDPKKYIQQLTGKLSQSLRKYNEGLPQPDADLNKYVAGMVVKQCIEGLPQEDVQEILKKVDSDEEEDIPQDNNMQQMPQDNQMQQPEQDPNMMPEQPMNENMSSRQGVASRYEELVNGNNEGSNNKVTNRNSYHKRPWVGKTFKS